MGAMAKQQLIEKDEYFIWASSSSFVSEQHHERYVKVSNGGRVITVSNALCSIRARNEKDEEDELTKARKEMEGAQRKHERLVEEEEKKKKKEEEKA